MLLFAHQIPAKTQTTLALFLFFLKLMGNIFEYNSPAHFFLFLHFSQTDRRSSPVLEVEGGEISLRAESS